MKFVRGACVVVVASLLCACGGYQAAETHGIVPNPNATAESLVGTTWTVGEFTAEFKDASTVFVKGGQLGEGQDGTYVISEGHIEVEIAGITQAGVYDGEKMAVDGLLAKKLQ